MILAYKIIEWLTYCRYNDSDRHLGSPSVNKMNWSALLGPTRNFTKENRVFILKNNLIIKFKKNFNNNTLCNQQSKGAGNIKCLPLSSLSPNQQA